MSVTRGDHRLRVELFGGPRVRGGVSGHVRLSPRQLALVAVVYGHSPRAVGRARAANLLWEAEAQADTRHRIRQLLVEVRSRCAGLIEASGDDLRASPEFDCDLRQFDNALVSGALADAAALARLGFAESPLSGLPECYVAWRTGVHAGLIKRLKARAAATWSRSVERGDWRAARDAAEALYCVDPHCPHVVTRVVEARARTGDLELAEGAYVAYLEAGGAIDLSSPIHDVIRRARRSASQVFGSGSKEAAAPFVGRCSALQSARSFFDQVARGHVGLVLISGESGIGKTRLLRELLREAHFMDFRCLSAQAVELESRIPLNPLLDALRDVDLVPHLKAIGAPWSAVIGAVLPPGTLAGPVDELPPIQEQALPRRLLDALSLLLQSLAREQPTLLFIDDLHWADTTTITALQFMQRRWAGGALGIVATVRRDLVRGEEPVSKYLTQAGRLITARIELEELTVDDGMELVRAVSDGRIDSLASRRLCALAGLHPLCLLELTRDYLSGRLTLPDTTAAELVIPVSLEQIIGARLQLLDTPSRRVAGFLAVGARPMRIQTLAALSETSLDDVADALATLQRARLVEVDHERVRIVHELFRSAIYQDLGEPRRSLHHRAIAERVLIEDGEDSVGELAVHYDRAGECELAAKYGWIAADRAMETGTVAEAGYLYQLVSKNERDPRKRAEAAAGHARALHLARDIARANPVLELAAFQLRAVGRPAEALRLEIKRIEGLAETGPVPIIVLTDSLVQLKRQASECADWEAVALALDLELHLLHRAEDVAGIRRVFDEMRRVAQQGSVEATILANAGLALCVLFGDPNEARMAAERAVGLSAGASMYRLVALVRLLVVLHYQGRLLTPSAGPVLDEARALAERSGDVLLRFSIEGNLAVGCLDAGDLERAEALMTKPPVISGTASMNLNRSNEANNRAELALAQADYSRAAMVYAEAASFLGPTTPDYLRDLVVAGLGVCALEQGHLAEARRCERELRPSPTHWHFDPTTILRFRAELLDRRGHRDAAIALLAAAAADLEGRLVLAWLKVRAMQVRLMLKERAPGTAELAIEARDRARELMLHHRASEFDSLLSRLGRWPT